MSPPNPATQDTRTSAPPQRAGASDNRAGPPKTRGLANMPPRRTWLTFAIILLVNYVVMSVLYPSTDTSITVPYTTFKDEVAKANVKSIYSTGASIEGRFVKPV
jgi:cell division protease FtsH